MFDSLRDTVKIRSSLPLVFTEDRGERLLFAADNLRLKLSELYDWSIAKRRQLRFIVGNNDLYNALLADDKEPIEGSRFSIGQCLNIYHTDWSRSRLKVCGVRSGGFSNAYTVVDLDEMRPYCLKENRATPGDEREKNEKMAIEAEISLLAGPSPHLVKTLSALYIQSRLFILTEYLPSISLDLQIKRSAIPLHLAIKFAIHICRGMIDAQKALPGFIHGDIKPGNCLVTSDGVLKLGDFGLASADGIGRRASATTAGEDEAESSFARGWGGTTAYMAPEMFDHFAPDRSRADIYALGVTLFEMICRSRPFACPTKAGLIEMHLTAAPPMDRLREKEVPGELVKLIENCLAKAASDRPAGFDVIERELLRIYRSLFGQDLPCEPESPPIEFASNQRALSFAALGKFDKAVEIVDREIEQDRSSAELLALKATVFSIAGKTRRAYAESTAALRKNPRPFPVLAAHARVLIARGRFEAAEDYLERALSMQPDNCLALNQLGHIYTLTNNTEQAISVFNRSLSIDDSQAEPYDHLAKIELLSGRFDRAIQFAKKSVAADPSRGSAHEILTEAYLSVGRTYEAFNSAKLALEFSSPLKERRHRFVRASIVADISAGVRPIKGLIRSLLYCAMVLESKEISRRSAERFAQKFLAVLQESDFDSRVLFLHDIALVKVADLLKQSTQEVLCEGFEQALNRSDGEDLSFHCYYSLGRVLYSFDRLEKCKEVFTKMLVRFAPTEGVYYYLGACAEIAEDFEASLTYYTKAQKLLDSEDSRTGINRVRSRLRNGSGRPRISKK